MIHVPARARQLLVALLGVLLGLAYGLLARLAVDRPPGAPPRPALAVAFAGMSVCFLFLVPLALGALTALFSPRTRWRWLYYLFLPVVPCLLLMAVVLALAWEGIICIVLASPIFFGMAIAGGAATGLVLWLIEHDKVRTSATAGTIVPALFLPFVLAPVESRVPPPDALREVTTSVAIDADARTVWRHIIRVPSIARSEQPWSFFHRIGVPRPLEAALSEEGIGGLRAARFEGGITFAETVTEWNPGEGFAFRIRVDPESIGPDVLDRHVKVGGEYFDVLHGRFRIEPAGGGVVLHLSSRHRLSTRFNAYAGLWTDAIMRDIQRTICVVVKRRSEAAE